MAYESPNANALRVGKEKEQVNYIRKKNKNEMK